MTYGTKTSSVKKKKYLLEMTTDEKLQEWIINETNFLSEKSLKSIPDVSTLSLLTEGKNKKIWDYILTHVRSKCTVQKVKRILKLKRDQSNPEKLFPKPDNDFSKLHQEIANAEDKQNFLKNSVSTIKKQIISTEEDLLDIRRNTDKIYHKTAILRLITLYYQEKTVLLNSLHSRLSLHLAGKVDKQNAKFPMNFEASAKKGYSAIPNEINPRVKYLLAQTESLVVKKFKNSPCISSFIINLQKSVIEVFQDASMYDLLLIVKEQSKTSYVNMMKRLSQNKSTFVPSTKDFSKRDSEKLLQELKFDYVNLNFSVKKIKNDNCKLMSEKGFLLMSKINPFSEDAEYQIKCQLLDKIAENESLEESILYLEEMLCNEQAKVNALKKINATETISNEDIITIQNKFYNDFDTMCLLQNSVPPMLDYIVKRYVDIHKFVNDELYSIMSIVLQEFPHGIEDELKFENEALWNVLRKNDIIEPMLQGTQILDQSVPGILWNMVDVAPFQNTIELCRNVKLFKDYVSFSYKNDWEYDEKRLLYTCEIYNNMTNMLEEIKNTLNFCEEQLETGLSYRSAIQIALEEWWNQSAQFIPDIVYDNKTLKMWIDIVNAADGVV